MDNWIVFHSNASPICLLASLTPGLAHVDAYIFPCVSCGDPSGQVSRAVSFLKSNGVKYGMIWLDIEIYAWSSNKASNQAFFSVRARLIMCDLRPPSLRAVYCHLDASCSRCCKRPSISGSMLASTPTTTTGAPSWALATLVR